MYISQILEYLIWPGFILIAWLTVNFALTAYEKKFQGKEKLFSEEKGDK
jgi:hypothetical protein